MSALSILIASWLEKNGGARRFEQGFNASFNAMQNYLASKGIMVVRYRMHYRISKPRGRHKLTDWNGVAALVDELRVSEGLEPLRFKDKAKGGKTAKRRQKTKQSCVNKQL